MVINNKLKISSLNLIRRQYKQLSIKISKLRKQGRVIYPEQENILNAFSYIKTFEDIRVVIVGQDPYHGEEEAQGLAFSVKMETKLPPSLVNIYKELKDDLGNVVIEHGCLENWAYQGILLLNRILTVEKDKPKSHANLGWELFTDNIIKYINTFSDNVVFILWGKEASCIENLITNKTHLILKASHPSPLSASRGFFGCRHFSKTNEFLKKNGFREIDWSVI